MVASFEDDKLTIKLANGASISGVVTSATKFECESEDARGAKP